MHQSSVRRVLATLAVVAALLFAWRYLSVSQRPAGPGVAMSAAPASAPPTVVKPRAETAPPAGSAARPARTTAAVANADRDSALAKLAAFEEWLSGWRTNPDPAVLARGRDLAVARRGALKSLIQSDPREALAHAALHRDRVRLPPEITRELEQPIDAFGEFELIAICDEHNSRYDRWSVIDGKRYATYTFGRRLESISKDRLAIHGIAVDDRLAMADGPCRRLDAGAGRIEVAVGDSVRSFASAADLARWIDGTMAAEAQIGPEPHAPGIAAAPAGWTIGEKTVLWIRAEFSDDPGSPATNDEIASAMGFVDGFYKDNSHGTCSFKATILPATVLLATTKATYGTSADTYITLRNDALQLARSYDAANGGTGLYNPDRYDRHVVIFKKITAYSWSGIASVGAKGLSLNGSSTGCVSAHELGHNQGLRHSHGWLPTAGSAIGAGTHLEYGDAFDDMGSAQAGNSAGHFNTVQKFNLGYLDADAITTVTQTGVYRLFRHDDRNSSGIRALKVATNMAGTNYWFEYRRAEPYAGFAAPSTGQPQLARLQSGIVAHWDKGPGFTSGPGTYLLDMTPGTMSGNTAPSESSSITHVLNDAALAFGESFLDPASGLVLTPFNAGGTAPTEWIDVFISLGATTNNRPPSVAASAPAGVISARNDVTLAATGADPDGDTVYYRWDFGDRTIPPGTASVTHRWLKGGTYAVKCTALDGRGGETTTTFNVTVTDPLLTWTRHAETLTTHWFYDVVFGGGKFVAVGSYVAAVSIDGVNWTVAQGLGNVYNYAVAYGNSMYAAVGYALNGSGRPNSTSIVTSADGLVWQNRSPADSAPDLKSICFGAGRFVAVGRSGIIFTSADGVAWTAVSSGTTNDLNAVRYGGGRFVAAGASATYLASADGITWEAVSPANETSTVYGLVYYQGAWLAVTNSYLAADSNKRIAFTSADGRSWTKAYLDAGVSFTSSIIPVANSTLLLAISRANDGQIFIAETPLHWESASVFPSSAAGTSTNLQAAAEGNGTIVVVGLSCEIFTPAGRPILATQPVAQSVAAGEPVTLSATAYATGPFTYQWYRNGTAVAGATGATLAIPRASSADAGSYTVVISNPSGSLTTNAAQVTVRAATIANVGRLTNLSILSTLTSASDAFMVGVVIGGAGTGGTKPLLVRAAGPSLTALGVSGVLEDPKLEFFTGSTKAAENDNWGGTDAIRTVAAQVGAFSYSAANSRDAAIALPNLAGRAHSARISGTGSGIVIAELYDATPADSFTTATPRLVNVSVLKHIGGGVTAGFVIGGSSRLTVLVRAVGPTLGAFGVGDVVSDPQLSLFSGQTPLSTNDNWGGTASLTAAFSRVGAFPLEPGSKDAALLVELPPGSYTAQVTGVGGTTGVALIEIYEVP